MAKLVYSCIIVTKARISYKLRLFAHVTSILASNITERATNQLQPLNIKSGRKSGIKFKAKYY